MRLSIIGISSEAWPLGAAPSSSSLKGVEILRLMCNLGHQRAIAVGLAKVARLSDYDGVIVMDCDGEDRPCDLIR